MPKEPITPTLQTINTQQEESLALSYLNQLRQGTGLIPFNSHKILNTATKNHANYLITNHTYGHYEESNKSGFTGNYASHRIVHSGYSVPLIIENVSSNNRNYKESIDGLFAAIYHRFAFLDFQGDEIGIAIKQNLLAKRETAFVYNMGSNALNQLYKIKSKPSKKELDEALDVHKNVNSKVVTYPFNMQTDVPPVFFDEMPDPMPKHDVSGFPISISFNQAHFKTIKLLNFELFNHKGKQINNTLTYDSKTDPHKRLDKFSFVLFPLDRLEWNSHYSVKFLAIVDKKLVEKNWSFKTRSYNIPLHKVSNENKTIDIKVNQENIFYFPPSTPQDLLRNVRYNNNFNMEFIDKNTLKITALKTSFTTTHLKIGLHDLKLNINN
jgi:uncharacterized protein YkwD